MFKVWTDGVDVVVARYMHDVPTVLNRQFRVTGHTLRCEAWREVPPCHVLRLRLANTERHVPASLLATEYRDAWVGRAL